MTRKYENLCSVSGRRKQMTWRHNNNWSICANLDPNMRTPCVDDQILEQVPTPSLFRPCESLSHLRYFKTLFDTYYLHNISRVHVSRKDVVMMQR